VRILITVVAAAAIAAAAGQSPAAAAAPPRVTFIGDSIPAGIQYEPAALRLLARGIDLDLQLAVCRRLVAESCPYKGTRPLTLVDLLPTIRLGPTVIVGVGYNEPESDYADAVEASLDALRKAGVERVLWLTLRAERESYLRMNDTLRAARAQHPELTVVDWNLYSRSHPDWFQDDGLHLGYDGAVAMATLIHTTLEKLGVVPVTAARLAITTRALPAGRVGKPYLARLAAAGGTKPVRWGRTAGSLPGGLRLLRDGRLMGTPRTSGRSAPTLRATDANGLAATRRFVIVIR
jgi:putative Ig domain-containing protein